ncbi:hypothetical protein MHYP_G00116120 [Metynnis hypsauchen]
MTFVKTQVTWWLRGIILEVTSSPSGYSGYTCASKNRPGCSEAAATCPALGSTAMMMCLVTTVMTTWAQLVQPIRKTSKLESHREQEKPVSNNSSTEQPALT